ncbi:MAG: EAL domain-containing protein [Oscillospiraceae bacterium]|nr:EAL domain-containing protein [Oscillospiraceae bacterium]
MLKSHEKIYSVNGKRQILIVDDEQINREILGMTLEDDYDVLYAADGADALVKIRENRLTLSLVLLDLRMPVKSGLEVIREMKNDPQIEKIPIIVLTAEQDAEIESLDLGAIDFIPKPYPSAGVIMARVRRTIELSEDRQIIQSTERDPLTGLYNREYFYRYAEQFDQHHQDTEMDAIVVDVNHFHTINERFGNAYGDSILRLIGEKVREMVLDTGGIVCRREADTFMVYCPHGKDYRAILDNAAVGLDGDDSVTNRVRLRMGVYANVDKSLEIERRMDRAQMAADTVRGSFTRAIGIYDSAMHEQELFLEQLIESFHSAICEKQFKVYYQPKFDVRPEIPVLSGAEALVRWIHPGLGMISPGMFIPLFEDNGLIRELDNYVWREAAAQIRDWKDRFGFSVPVSVNVSRIDMYDPNMVDTLQGIVRENGLRPHDLQLEITESAYTKDSEQIIETVNRLRTLGFEIEMDDFGTGYSSLNMISSLPIDALKLDMQFIRSAFNQRKDTRMLEVILDIAEYLSVPVIAEGVETEEQFNALKSMGCDMVQGYYFSPPVPAEKYERFVIERRDLNVALLKGSADNKDLNVPGDSSAFGKIACALSCGFESIYYVNTENNHYVKFSPEGRYEDLQIEHSGADFFADAARSTGRVIWPEDRERVTRCLRKDKLVERVSEGPPFAMAYRQIVDGAPVCYSLIAVRAANNDDRHIVIGVSNIDDQLREIGEGENDNSALNFTGLAKALARDYFSIYYVDSETDRFLEYSSAESGFSLGIERSGEDFFNRSRRNILRSVYPEDQQMVSEALQKEYIMAALENNRSYTLTYRMMRGGEPTYVHLKASRMEDPNDQHIVIGVSNIDVQMKREQEQATALRLAREAANRDALTGVKSKHAYVQTEGEINKEIRSGEIKAFGVIMCDINGLKEANDSLGHAAGDDLLRSAAMEICNIFTHSPVFRYGGDEFVVLLRGRDYDNRAALVEQFTRENKASVKKGGAAIACGMAEYDPARDTVMADVFARADAAMYENKKNLKKTSAEQK